MSSSKTRVENPQFMALLRVMMKSELAVVCSLRNVSPSKATSYHMTAQLSTNSEWKPPLPKVQRIHRPFEVYHSSDGSPVEHFTPSRSSSHLVAPRWIKVPLIDGIVVGVLKRRARATSTMVGSSASITSVMVSTGLHRTVAPSRRTIKQFPPTLILDLHPSSIRSVSQFLELTQFTMATCDPTIDQLIRWRSLNITHPPFCDFSTIRTFTPADWCLYIGTHFFVLLMVWLFIRSAKNSAARMIILELEEKEASLQGQIDALRSLNLLQAESCDEKGALGLNSAAVDTVMAMRGSDDEFWELEAGTGERKAAVVPKAAIAVPERDHKWQMTAFFGGENFWFAVPSTIFVLTWGMFIRLNMDWRYIRYVQRGHTISAPC
jgi:hypothetical protein